jgi:hypothetical protein
MQAHVEQKTIATMPAQARVWVYKCASAFTPAQRSLILERGDGFTRSWAAHGAALDACVDVLYDHLVVIAVDEEQAAASGCSIDKSVHFIKSLEQELGLSLTDRMVVLYGEPEALKVTRVPDAESMIRSGALTADTLVVDDLVHTVGDLRFRLIMPLRDTWMSRWLS